MIKLNQKAAQGLVEIFAEITKLGAQAQVALPVDHETTLILGVSPQGQLIITPIKTAVLLVEAPEDESNVVGLNTSQSRAQIPASEPAPFL